MYLITIAIADPGVKEKKIKMNNNNGKLRFVQTEVGNKGKTRRTTNSCLSIMLFNKGRCLRCGFKTSRRSTVSQKYPEQCIDMCYTTVV
jgi:hypothetical protein